MNIKKIITISALFALPMTASLAQELAAEDNTEADNTKYYSLCTIPKKTLANVTKLQKEIPAIQFFNKSSQKGDFLTTYSYDPKSDSPVTVYKIVPGLAPDRPSDTNCSEFYCSIETDPRCPNIVNAGDNTALKDNQKVICRYAALLNQSAETTKKTQIRDLNKEINKKYKETFL